MTHAENRMKPSRGRTVGTLLGALLIAVLLVSGPVLIGIGAGISAAEDDLARTGAHAEGTVSTVQDGAEVSRQRFRVEYVAADASRHSLWLFWSTDERPVEGETVDVVYRDSDPGFAIVEGYDGGGVPVTGIGVSLTIVFGLSGVVLAVLLARGRTKRRRRARDSAE